MGVAPIIGAVTAAAAIGSAIIGSNGAKKAAQTTARAASSAAGVSALGNSLGTSPVSVDSQTKATDSVRRAALIGARPGVLTSNQGDMSTPNLGRGRLLGY